MSLFNFSFKGESLPSGKLESITRKFELELDNMIPVKSINHTIYSVAFFKRMETFAQLLNTHLYTVAAADGIIINRLHITITGNIIRESSRDNYGSNKMLDQIDVAIGITSDAEEKALSALLIKARNKTMALKNIRNTKFNYAINSIVHLN